MQSLKKKLQSDSKGFTIIEVMIVLVIAAVILLIVFLAVPALQRNNRNTQRKSEAARLLAAAGEWRTANQNNWPQTCLLAFGCAPASAADVQRTQIYGLAGTVNSFPVTNFSTMNAATGQTGDLAASTSNFGNAVRANIDNIIVFGQANCSGTTLNTGSGLVVVYGIEAGSGVQVQCINS